MDPLPRVGKSELAFLISFTCNYMVSVSSSWCLGYTMVFYCGTPGPFIYFFTMITMQSHISNIDLLLKTLYSVFMWSH